MTTAMGQRPTGLVLDGVCGLGRKLPGEVETSWEPSILVEPPSPAQGVPIQLPQLYQEPLSNRGGGAGSLRQAPLR